MLRSTFAATIALLAGSLAAPAAGSAQEVKLDDPTIVAIFDATNTADMETGALAQKQGSSKEVRDFGAMLARDHEMVRQQGRDLAANQNQELKALVEKVAPAFEAHRKMAEELGKKVASK